MKILELLRAAVAVCAFAITAHVSASPTLLVNSEGVLTGANGVDVGGIFYNVAFADGSCNSLFKGCAQSAFAFSDQTTAKLAARSLLDQVFVDGPAGQFDSLPYMTFGCGTPSYNDDCRALIPYAASQVQVFSGFAINGKSENGDWTSVVTLSFGPTQDTTMDTYLTYALFQLAPPTSQVPEPSSIALFVLAAVGLRFARRRNTKV